MQVRTFLFVVLTVAWQKPAAAVCVLSLGFEPQPCTCQASTPPLSCSQPLGILFSDDPLSKLIGVDSGSSALEDGHCVKLEYSSG